MSDVRDPERDQVAPTINENRPVQDMVVEDILERKEHGIRKYGTPVQANNGRSMILDAYEEILDLAVYLRAAMEEGTDFEMRSEAQREFRVVDANGNVTAGDLWRRSAVEVYMDLREGESIQQKYKTYTSRSEWGDLSPEAQTQIREHDEQTARRNERRR